MNYGQVKAAFLSRLTRRDVTPTLVNTWMDETIRRAQRLLRTPAQEKTVVYKIGSVFNGLTIPGDFLSLVSIDVDDVELTRSSRQEVTSLAQHRGSSTIFCRDAGTFIIGPRPLPGAVISMTYRSNFTDLVADTDSNFLTEVAPDVLINGAMKLACVHFVDARSEAFEAEFVTAIVDINNMSDLDELTNASIRRLP